MLTIVIGDIHGMAVKLENLLVQIDMWCAANAGAELRQLIFLGDYIDRGPDSREVLQIVQRLQAEGAICLRGNHEERNRKGTVQISSPTAAMQPSPPWARRPRSGKRKNGCVRSRPAMKTKSVIMFTRGSVRTYPSTSRPPKRNFGYVTASFVIRDCSRNTLSMAIRRRSILIRSKRCRTCATTAATSIRALE
jgi:Calcineurin-like phosphoesterase